MHSIAAILRRKKMRQEENGRTYPYGAIESDLDLSRNFLPESLVGILEKTLGVEDRRRLNQIQASSYLRIFDRFEGLVSRVARRRVSERSRSTLEPLLREGVFDHNELFRSFDRAFTRVVPIPEDPSIFDDLERTLEHVSPLSLVIFALHLKLVTQQHYLAALRNDPPLEPHFVDILKSHWNVECGASERERGLVRAFEQVLADAPPSRAVPALRDYRLVLFAADDALYKQAVLDAAALEAMRGAALPEADRARVIHVEREAHRKTFLTVGVVNAAFVYAMRSLGPSAPATLAGVVSALASRS